jgi:hypothetical protein
VLPPPFQPPVYDRLAQSIKEWMDAADAKWKQHRDAFVQICRRWEELGVDETIPRPSKTRDQGRRNADPDRRYEWAALSLARRSWKQIAIDDGAETAEQIRTRADTVRKAAIQILQRAGWLPKRKQRNPLNSEFNAGR